MIKIHYYGAELNNGMSGDILDIVVPDEAWKDETERTLSAQIAYDDEALEEQTFHGLCDLAIDCLTALAPKLAEPVELKLSDVSCYGADDIVIEPTDGEVDDSDGFFYDGEFLHGDDLRHCKFNVDAYVMVKED